MAGKSRYRVDTRKKILQGGVLASCGIAAVVFACAHSIPAKNWLLTMGLYSLSSRGLAFGAGNPVSVHGMSLMAWVCWVVAVTACWAGWVYSSYADEDLEQARMDVDEKTRREEMLREKEAQEVHRRQIEQASQMDTP